MYIIILLLCAIPLTATDSLVRFRWRYIEPVEEVRKEKCVQRPQFQLTYLKWPSDNEVPKRYSAAKKIPPRIRDCCRKEVLIEGKAAWYYPTNHHFRKKYGSGGIYTLEGNFQAYEEFYIFASASLFDQHHIYFIPLELGAKWLRHFWANGRRCAFYLGAGAVGTYVHAKSHRWGFGGNWKTGWICYMNRHFTIDVFSEYTYTKVHHLNISGLSVGGGIGYSF